MVKSFGEIKCPYCPYCGSQPSMGWVEITPWFCPADGCECLAWDPYVSAKQNIDSVHNVDPYGEPLPPTD